MNDITRILTAIDEGDPHAAEQLLPLVYDELRKLAAAKLAQEKPGQTLQATALVHEAYLRLVASETKDQPAAPASGEASARREPHWDSRGHFFAAAAQAMRRILIDNARHKQAEKHGGNLVRVPLAQAGAVAADSPENLLALDEALERLGRHDPLAAQLVKLRHFAGLSVEEAARALGLSTATAYRHWTFARAWLHAQLGVKES